MTQSGQRKRGRPTEDERIARRFEFLRQLAVTYPPLAEFLAYIEAGVDDTLETRLKSLEAYLADIQANAPDTADVKNVTDKSVRHAKLYSAYSLLSAAFGRAAATFEAASALAKTTADEEWGSFKATLPHASVPLSQEVIELARAMSAAGVTASALRLPKIKAAVETALRGQNGPIARVAGLPRRLPPPPLSELRALWNGLPKSILGFKLAEREAKSMLMAEEEMKYCLPPFTSLDNLTFGLSRKVEETGSNGERYKLIAKEVTKWTAKHHYRMQSDVHEFQVRAWTFVFCWSLGYLDDSFKLGRITLPSPFSDLVLTVEQA